MSAQSKTIRRDWLKRQVAQGKMEAWQQFQAKHGLNLNEATTAVIG